MCHKCLWGKELRLLRYNPNVARQGNDAASRCWRAPFSVKTRSSVRLADTASQITMVRTRGVTAATAIRVPQSQIRLFRRSGRGRRRFAAADRAGLSRVRPAFDGGLGQQQRIRHRFLLHRRPSAAEDGTAQENDDPTDVMEFPRHVSHPAEDFHGSGRRGNSTLSPVFRWKFVRHCRKNCRPAAPARIVLAGAAAW
jgi:hypothetical protein